MMKKPSPMKFYEMGEGFLSEKSLLFLFALLNFENWKKLLRFSVTFLKIFSLYIIK